MNYKKFEITKNILYIFQWAIYKVTVKITFIMIKKNNYFWNNFFDANYLYLMFDNYGTFLKQLNKYHHSLRLFRERIINCSFILPVK